jgi:hypothetical protein
MCRDDVRCRVVIVEGGAQFVKTFEVENKQGEGESMTSRERMMKEV